MQICIAPDLLARRGLKPARDSRRSSMFLLLAALLSSVAWADVVPNQDFGTYPNCLPPAIPVESQSWWDEKAAPLPSDNAADLPDAQRLTSKFRHVHLGKCIPNERTLHDTRLTLSGTYDHFRAVMVLHNNPGTIGWNNFGVVGGSSVIVFKKTCTDFATCDSVPWQQQSNRCVGDALSCVTYTPPLSCPVGQTCQFPVRMKLNIAAGSCQGDCEMRMKPNLTNIAPRGDRQFTTNNFQVFLGGSGSYRSSPAPIGRGWYTGLEYVNATLKNYMSFFQGRTDIAVPIVTGTVALSVNHAQGSGTTVRSHLAIDPDGHMDVPGTVLYNVAGLKSGTVSLDTTTLANGLHRLRILTEEANSFGRSFGGAVYWINVQN